MVVSLIYYTVNLATFLIILMSEPFTSRERMVGVARVVFLLP